MMVWLFTRPMRLEITQTQVRAFHGVDPPEMVRAARVLRVPVYDDRVGQLKVRERNEAKLVYDPESGLAAGT